MKPRRRKWQRQRQGVLSALAIGLAAFCQADLAENLENKAIEAGRMAERYHVRDGLLIPTRIEVIEGPTVYDATSQEDVCTRTGEYLFALCFEYLVTGDDDAYRRARRTARGVRTCPRSRQSSI